MHGPNRWWNPFKTGRRLLILGSFWTAAGATCILFTVAWHASGEYAMLGGFWIVLALLNFGAAFEQHRDRRG
jgi:hypothetical protein